MIFYHQIKLKKKEERKKKERKKKTKGVELCISILSVRDILKIWASHLRNKVAE